MDVKGKTNDNIKVIKDLALHCDHGNMDLINDGFHVANLKASFVVDKDAQLLVYEWLKSLWFPDEYTSNIARFKNLEGYKLYEIKNHDNHEFMLILIPIIYRGLLQKIIWDALINISHCFGDICSNKLHTQNKEQLGMNIIKIICNLQMIFPSSFLDSMEHLLIHLVYKAKVRGPMQYKKVYPFKRLGIS